MTGQPALDAAARMGARAGAAFRATGVPSRNPFDQEKLPALAAAWRGPYLDALKPTT